MVVAHIPKGCFERTSRSGRGRPTQILMMFVAVAVTAMD